MKMGGFDHPCEMCRKQFQARIKELEDTIKRLNKKIRGNKDVH